MAESWRGVVPLTLIRHQVPTLVSPSSDILHPFSYSLFMLATASTVLYEAYHNLSPSRATQEQISGVHTHTAAEEHSSYLTLAICKCTSARRASLSPSDSVLVPYSKLRSIFQRCGENSRLAGMRVS